MHQKETLGEVPHEDEPEKSEAPESDFHIEGFKKIQKKPKKEEPVKNSFDDYASKEDEYENELLRKAKMSKDDIYEGSSINLDSKTE